MPFSQIGLLRPLCAGWQQAAERARGSHDASAAARCADQRTGLGASREGACCRIQPCRRRPHLAYQLRSLSAPASRCVPRAWGALQRGWQQMLFVLAALHARNQRWSSQDRGNMLAAKDCSMPQGRSRLSCHGLTGHVVADSMAPMWPADLSATSLLSWSPSGTYLLEASSASSSFRLWSAETWESKPFSSPNANLNHTKRSSSDLRSHAANCVTGACWHKHSKVVLLGFQHSNSLVAVHLVGTAPSLDCQLLSVPLSGVSGVQRLTTWQSVADISHCAFVHPVSSCPTLRLEHHS